MNKVCQEEIIRSLRAFQKFVEQSLAPDDAKQQVESLRTANAAGDLELRETIQSEEAWRKCSEVLKQRLKENTQLEEMNARQYDTIQKMREENARLNEQFLKAQGNMNAEFGRVLDLEAKVKDLEHQNKCLNGELSKRLTQPSVAEYWHVRIARDNLRDRLVHQSTTITDLREEIKNLTRTRLLEIIPETSSTEEYKALGERNARQYNIIQGLRAEIKNMHEDIRRTNEVTIGVGSGDTNLFVHGTYEATRACQDKLMKLERLVAAGARDVSLPEASIGVGNGPGSLFLHGSYEATKVCQEKLLRMERAEAALHRIRIEGGRVCPTYEGCTHVWCQSSYDAWAIADRALRRIP